MKNLNYPTLEDIKAAHTRIQPFIHHTPVLTSSAINNIAGCEIFFKCENLQKVGAFKARGAANAVSKLSAVEKIKGVATHSSGNHAAALARAAKVAGIPAYIVMPSTAPDIKKAAVKGYGGVIIECKPNQAAREETLAKVVKDTGAIFVPPYDHMDVIEGQATCGLEFINEISGLNFILAPVGGGGLISGTALIAHYLDPKVQVIGGEPEGANDAYLSFSSKEHLPMLEPNTIADGLLTSLGKINFDIILKYLVDILTVNDEQIVAAMKLIMERMKIIIEPSCAVPLAVVLANKERFSEKKIGIILSGGNVNLAKLPF